VLTLVPTPLGNLGDITRRAVETLKSADLVVAEDTRVARRLLNALGIGPKELWSYREQNAAAVTKGILERARSENVVFMSDAGMPAVSDPGSDLVTAARTGGIPIDVLPGPSATLGVAVLSGFTLRRFAFEGFPPRSKSARIAAFRAALAIGATTIWFESPQRIHDTLGDLAGLAPDARVFLVREYTAREVAGALATPVRGEIAFAIAPYELAPALAKAPVELDSAIDTMLEEGRSVREIAKALSEIGAGDRREIYAAASERKRRRSGKTPA